VGVETADFFACTRPDIQTFWGLKDRATGTLTQVAYHLRMLLDGGVVARRQSYILPEAQGPSFGVGWKVGKCLKVFKSHVFTVSL
jgi:hypothetical protein